MQRLRARRPSAAMTVAVIALIAALSGTAVADNAVDFAKTKVLNGKNIKKKSIAGNKLRNNTVTGTQVNESKLGKVPSASKADSATSAGNADTLDGVDSGGFAKAGASAPPRAYARVNDDGSLDTANSFNVIDSVLGTNPGRYCFKLGFTPKVMVASAERFVGASNGVVAEPAVSSTISVVCPAGYQDAGVFVFDGANAVTNNRFWIIFE
jgi:hypothetical protein